MAHYEEAYLDYLVHFHSTRDYFECHEIMEDHWLESGKDVRWLALIQLAVAVYHERQKNWNGSNRLYERTRQHILANPQMLESLAIDENKLLMMVEERLERIHFRAEYEPFNLPLQDAELIESARLRAEEKGLHWQSDDSADPSLNPMVSRHKIRDRSEVVEAREKALAEKQKKREGQ
ncbi:DUF309 domain-containing protein [Salisediminibacterium halotolerans]|uniref:DUF309 domain-containing protein n=1 Tax=Salisediminibacterium halotolerans TaxID=517425 RepID=A0A1H9P8D4_9BACI|nr:DUF309 domain-containing protein [Salisediminibacterium haloalkalitolerans]SER44478.1 hypothetical protein SAMN05444126_101119 [Salisediminibacterium haloalkalitolerans]